MKLFFDLEFTGLFQNADPISIGMVSEEGHTFYAEFNNYNVNLIGPWHEQHVIPSLRFGRSYSDPQIDLDHHAMCANMADIDRRMREWIKQFEEVEMWGDTLAYDWVIFCQMFGGAFGIPKNIFYIPFDVSTLFRMYGVDPDISREEYVGMTGRKHNALWDARVIKACYDKLEKDYGPFREMERAPKPGDDPG